MGLRATANDRDITPNLTSLQVQIAGDLTVSGTLGLQEYGTFTGLRPDLGTGAQLRCWWEREDGLVLYRYLGGESLNPRTRYGDSGSLHARTHTVPVQGWGRLLDTLAIEDTILTVGAGTYPEQVAVVFAYLRGGAPGDPGAEVPIDAVTYVEDLGNGAILPPHTFTMQSAREMIEAITNEARVVNPNLQAFYTIAQSQILYSSNFAGPYFYATDLASGGSIVAEFGDGSVLGTTSNLNMRPAMGVVDLSEETRGQLINRVAARNTGGLVVAREQSSAIAERYDPYSPNGARTRILRDVEDADADLPDRALREAQTEAFIIPTISFQAPIFILPGQRIVFYSAWIAADLQDPAWLTGKTLTVSNFNLSWSQPQGQVVGVTQPLFTITAGVRRAQQGDRRPRALDLSTVVARSPAVATRNQVATTKAGIDAMTYKDWLTGKHNSWVDDAGHRHPAEHVLEFKKSGYHTTTFSYAVKHVERIHPSPIPGGVTISYSNGETGAPLTLPADLAAGTRVRVTVAGMTTPFEVVLKETRPLV